MITTNAFAFDVNLARQGIINVDELVDMGAEHSQCAQAGPRCILMGTNYGIQYPSQTLKDVVLTETTDRSCTVSLLKELKREGFC